MSTQKTKRNVARIESPAIQVGMTPAHRVRQLVGTGDQAATDPFLLLMEDWFPIGVFDRHPHRGMETVTYVLEGAVDHYDNHGNSGSIGAGEVLWMTAGRGIVHNEIPANDQPVHLLQLWVNLPAAAKMVPARFQELGATSVPVRGEDGVEVRVFSGASGPAVSPTLNYAPVTMVEMQLEPNATFEQELPAGYNGFIVVIDGSGAVGSSDVPVRAGQIAWLTKSETASVIGLHGGEGGLRAILFAGLPLGEPIAARGPFVMNTELELQQTYAEFRHAGDRFGLD